ncbi:unnamed protein product [Caenorhabditis brenneri]
MFNAFVFNILLVTHFLLLVAVCGKRRNTTRNNSKPKVKQSSKKVQVKPKVINAPCHSKTSTRNSVPVKRVIGCQPTREDEGMEIETESRTRTNSDEILQKRTTSDEIIKKEQNSKSQEKSHSEKSQKRKETLVLSIRPAVTTKASESSKFHRADEISSKRTHKDQQRTRSESSDESENPSPETSKKSSKNENDDEKTSNLESIQTEDDELIKH